MKKSFSFPPSRPRIKGGGASKTGQQHLSKSHSALILTDPSDDDDDDTGATNNWSWGKYSPAPPPKQHHPHKNNSYKQHHNHLAFRLDELERLVCSTIPALTGDSRGLQFQGLAVRCGAKAVSSVSSSSSSTFQPLLYTPEAVSLSDWLCCVLADNETSTLLPAIVLASVHSAVGWIHEAGRRFEAATRSYLLAAWVLSHCCCCTMVSWHLPEQQQQQPQSSLHDQQLAITVHRLGSCYGNIAQHAMEKALLAWAFDVSLSSSPTTSTSTTMTAVLPTKARTTFMLAAAVVRRRVLFRDRRQQRQAKTSCIISDTATTTMSQEDYYSSAASVVTSTTGTSSSTLGSSTFLPKNKVAALWTVLEEEREGDVGDDCVGSCGRGTTTATTTTSRSSMEACQNGERYNHES
jgi:hypothetical protein